MNTKTFLFVATFFTLSIAANAQANNTQKQRVKQGVKSDEITKAEADKIREERKEVRAEVKGAKADGTVTKEEKKDIKQERKDAKKAIVRAKHNNKTRN
jgi:uncharacterized membrane protein YebE (DUF533 family)